MNFAILLSHFALPFDNEPHYRVESEEENRFSSLSTSAEGPPFWE